MTDKRFRDKVRELVREEGILTAGWVLLSLVPIAVCLLIPELLRMLACKLFRQPYRSPTQRVLDGAAKNDKGGDSP